MMNFARTIRQYNQQTKRAGIAGGVCTIKWSDLRFHKSAQNSVKHCQITFNPYASIKGNPAKFINYINNGFL